MTSIRSVAALLLEDTNRHSRSRLKRMLSIANWLGAEIHFITLADRTESISQQIQYSITEMKMKNSAFVHSVAMLSLDMLLDAIKDCHAGLIILGYPGEKRLTAEQSTLRRSFFESLSLPIILLPHSYNEKSAGPGSLIVPLSSESKKSDALALALELATQSETPVDLMHVIESKKWNHKKISKDELALESISDQFHHEYAQVVDRTVASASPLSTIGQKRWIRSYRRCNGEIIDQISKIASERGTSMIVLDWHGTLVPGRAETIKRILSKTDHPIILVKSGKASQMRLKSA